MQAFVHPPPPCKNSWIRACICHIKGKSRLIYHLPSVMYQDVTLTMAPDRLVYLVISWIKMFTKKKGLHLITIINTVASHRQCNTKPACEVLAGLAYFYPVVHLTTQVETALPQCEGQTEVKIAKTGSELGILWYFNYYTPTRSFPAQQ